MDKTLVILAAGIGSRYGGFKQMEPIGPSGEFIIDYSIYDAIRAGFNTVVFLISRAVENDFKATIGKRVSRRVAVDYAFQDPNPLAVFKTVKPPKAPVCVRTRTGRYVPPADRKKPWGTGHALLSCRDLVNEPFAAINADDYYGQDSYRVLAGFLDATAKKDSQYAMVGFILRNTISEHGHVARGVCSADNKGILKSIVERTRIEPQPEGIRFLGEDNRWHSLTGDELVSMNLWGFKTSIFSHLESQFRTFLESSARDVKAEFFIPPVVNDLIAEGKVCVRVLETSSHWIGITHPQDKEPVVAKIRSLVNDGVYPPNLWA